MPSGESLIPDVRLKHTELQTPCQNEWKPCSLPCKTNYRSTACVLKPSWRNSKAERTSLWDGKHFNFGMGAWWWPGKQLFHDQITTSVWWMKATLLRWPRKDASCVLKGDVGYWFMSWPWQLLHLPMELNVKRMRMLLGEISQCPSEWDGNPDDGRQKDYLNSLWGKAQELFWCIPLASGLDCGN